MTKIQGTTFSSIGKCIYCLSTEGSRSEEHIIPNCLNGYHYFAEASCIQCQKITQKYETHIAKSTYPLLRSLEKFRSRSKNYTTTISIELEYNGNIRRVVDEPIENVPLNIIIPYFTLPPFLNKIPNWPLSTTLEAKQLQSKEEADKKFKALFKKYGGHRASVLTGPIKVENFVLLLYKISAGFLWNTAPDIAELSPIPKLAITEKFPDYPNFTNLYSAPKRFSDASYYEIRIFTADVAGEKRLFSGINILSKAFPEYFCDFGQYDGTDFEQIYKC